MAISENAQKFLGLPVKDYSTKKGVETPAGVVYRLRTDYDEEEPFAEQLAHFLADPRAAQAPGLIIGQWAGEMVDNTPASVLAALVKEKARLPALRGFFLGDITYEENEISWINQCDVSPLWAAFPQLEVFRVRGGTGLSLGQLKHEALRTLIVEAGGLPREVVQQVASSDLPALEHLELWLGTDEYGGDATVDDLAPILDGHLFPRLRYLGLRDSRIADDVAAAVALSPLLERIRVLDLSLGTLGQKGAEALLASPPVARLEKLDIHHHYVSRPLVGRLQGLGIEIDASDAKTPEKWDNEEHRYVAVSE